MREKESNGYFLFPSSKEITIRFPFPVSLVVVESTTGHKVRQMKGMVRERIFGKEWNVS